MLPLQHRLRDLLASCEWFAAPVQIVVEDRDGIAYLVKKYTGALSAPLVILQTTAGSCTRRTAGIALVEEEVTVSIVTNPATDKSGRQTMDGVAAAIATVNDALVDASPDARQDSPRFQFTGHADASTTPGEVVHALTFSALIGIKKSPNP